MAWGLRHERRADRTWELDMSKSMCVIPVLCDLLILQSSHAHLSWDRFIIVGNTEFCTEYDDLYYFNSALWYSIIYSVSTYNYLTHNYLILHLFNSTVVLILYLTFFGNVKRGLYIYYRTHKSRKLSSRYIFIWHWSGSVEYLQAIE
jgi:hypothetical protein